MVYVAFVLVLAVVIFYIFRWRARRIPDTSIREEKTTPSRKWVFNGILDIDNPPPDKKPFINYPDKLELRVKPGFMHYDLVLDELTDDSMLGLYKVRVVVENERIGVYGDKGCIGHLPDGQQQFIVKLQKKGGATDNAYAFIARRKTPEGDAYWGEVAVEAS